MNTQNNKEPADFETAISATGFGFFNIILLICCLPGAMVCIMDNTVISYVIPVAKCDLELTIQQTGILNSAFFVGFIISSYLWGFLGDTLGRKRVLWWTLTLDFVINFIGSFTQTFVLQYIFKFLNGFASSGPYILIITYISEMCPSKYQSKMVLMLGAFMTSSTIVVPFIAWGIIPYKSLQLNSYVLHSWQMFLLIATIPALFSSIVFAFLPESPKYLMLVNKPEKALEVFKFIYRWNTGQPTETYPIKHLKIGEQYVTTAESDTMKLDSLKRPNLLKLLQIGLMQIKPMFQAPYLVKITLVITIHFGIILTGNSVRLWLPQVFTALEDYNKINGRGSVCDVINSVYKQNETTNITINDTNAPCIPVTQTDQVYINCLIVAITCFASNLIMMFFVNKFPKKYILVFLVMVESLASICIYWAPNQTLLIILATIQIVHMLLASIVLMALIVEIFPTNFRAVAVSLALMTAQLGSIVGNLFFTMLLQTGCLAPFLFVGILVGICGVLCFFLPNSTKY